MRIESVSEIKSFIIEAESFDGTEAFTYQRYSKDSWDKLYGESWEPVYDKDDLEDLEKLFQEYQSRFNSTPDRLRMDDQV